MSTVGCEVLDLSLLVTAKYRMSSAVCTTSIMSLYFCMFKRGCTIHIFLYIIADYCHCKLYSIIYSIITSIYCIYYAKTVSSHVFLLNDFKVYNAGNDMVRIIMKIAMCAMLYLKNYYKVVGSLKEEANDSKVIQRHKVHECGGGQF